MKATSLKIEVADEQDQNVDLSVLVKIASLILDDHGFSEGELSIALVDDPTIRELNRQYLNHDWETDVISFVLESAKPLLSGQLIVSTDTARNMAAELGSTFAEEMALYVAHGTLHLVGFDDTDEVSAKAMKAAERDYLQQFSINCTNRET